jgi:hypothetical protein
VNSATGTALAPAVMATGIPRACAAARSILSTPIPHFWMRRSPGAASIRLAGIAEIPPTKNIASFASPTRSRRSSDVAMRSSSLAGHSATMTARTSGSCASRTTTIGRVTDYSRRPAAVAGAGSSSGSIGISTIAGWPPSSAARTVSPIAPGYST